MKRETFYRCPVCGNMVVKVVDGGGKLVDADSIPAGQFVMMWNLYKYIMENDREAVKLVSQMQGEGISSVTVRKLTVRDYAEVENAVFD